MSRQLSALTIVAAVAVFAVACSESSMAPEGAASRAPTVATPVQLSEAQIAGAGAPYRFEFTVSPNGTRYSDGVNSIVFPANSVCDPATSTYGVTEWDQPCATITQPLTIEVELSQVNGRRVVMFHPNVRFEPSKRVTLMMSVEALRDESLTIYWTPDGQQLIDEARDDRSLATRYAGGKAIRRIKHFSGFIPASGVVEVPPCQEGDETETTCDK